MNYNRLKKRTVIIAIGCLLILLSLNDARGSDWVVFGKDVLGNNWFYDKDSVLNVSKEIIKVWTKTVVSDEGRANLINQYNKGGVPTIGYGSLSVKEDLWFISCEDKKYEITQSTLYASHGRVLSATHYDDSWIDVNKSSMIKVLMKELCKKPSSSK